MGEPGRSAPNGEQTLIRVRLLAANRPRSSDTRCLRSPTSQYQLATAARTRAARPKHRPSLIIETLQTPKAIDYLIASAGLGIRSHIALRPANRPPRLDAPCALLAARLALTSAAVSQRAGGIHEGPLRSSRVQQLPPHIFR